MSLNLKTNRKGFSIGEVMLSVFVVATALVVVSGLMARTLKVFYDDRDVVIATNLSQEGVELVRNIRDNDFVLGNDFGDGLGTTPGPENYVIERGSSLTDASGDEYLYFDNNEGYNHSALGEPTKFSRRIIIEGDSDSRSIISMVIWNRDVNFPEVNDCVVAENCVLTKSILTNWKEEPVL